MLLVTKDMEGNAIKSLLRALTMKNRDIKPKTTQLNNKTHRRVWKGS